MNPGIGPTLLEAARMNRAAYLGDDHAPVLDGWSRVERHAELGVDRWENEQGYIYLALAGTRKNRRDLVDSLRIFLGQIPDDRISQVSHYVRDHCGQSLSQDQVALGGHSSGGLVAMSVAAQFHLPALIQNAPGYFKQAPDQARCDRVIEIRTARDLVSDWGSNTANQITLHDPAAPGWKLSLLHAIARQNDLLAEQPMLASAHLSGADMVGIQTNPDTAPTGNTWQSILTSWRRLRGHCEALTQGQTPLSQSQVAFDAPADPSGRADFSTLIGEARERANPIRDAGRKPVPAP